MYGSCCVISISCILLTTRIVTKIPATHVEREREREREEEEEGGGGTREKKKANNKKISDNTIPYIYLAVDFLLLFCLFGTYRTLPCDCRPRFLPTDNSE